MKLQSAFRERYLDVLGSIYIYNEHRGYTSLDRVLEAVALHSPGDHSFRAEITKHRADEHKHYRMFRRWFELKGRMPLAVDHGCGHIDRFIQWVFRCSIDELDTGAVVATPGEFERLCRVIMLTEQRGLRQVEVLLRSPIVRSDPALRRIFEVVHRDEPDHFLPYRRWLERNGMAQVRWNERAADWCIHKVLMLYKLPSLFLDSGAQRMAQWPDDAAHNSA
jgi:rubrerythrin